HVLPSPRVLIGSSCVILVTVTVTGSPSGSVTPRIEIPTYLWFGGHSTAGEAVAALQFGGLFVTTLIVIEHSDCAPQLSVALKVTTWGPLSASAGVQVKSEQTGLPTAGSNGVMLAPEGRPPVLRLTWPPSGSLVHTVNDTGVPAATVFVDPHAGVGATNVGAELVVSHGDRKMRKSTA